MRILLVEDDRSLCEIVARNLSARGHAVRQAETAEGALREMQQETPEALVLDVNLPDFSAWEVLRRIGPELAQRPRVVVMSAYPISRKRLAEFKPQGALQKPFPIGALIHAVEDTSHEVVSVEGRGGASEFSRGTR